MNYPRARRHVCVADLVASGRAVVTGYNEGVTDARKQDSTAMPGVEMVPPDSVAEPILAMIGHLYMTYDAALDLAEPSPFPRPSEN